MEEVVWNEFFTIDDGPRTFKGAQSKQVNRLSAGTSVICFCLFNMFQEASIFVENVESRLLISDSCFENSISQTTGAIAFSTVRGPNRRTDFIMNRCCGFRCGSRDKGYHFLNASIADGLMNRNYVIDSSIAWCGHTKSTHHYIRKQFFGLIVNKRVNDSYCADEVHAGLSLYGESSSAHSKYLTISHNNATEGRFFHCVKLPSYAQFIVLEHNIDLRGKVGMFDISNSTLEVSECIIMNNNCKLCQVWEGRLSFRNTVFSGNENMDTTGASIEEEGDFGADEWVVRHYASRQCEAALSLFKRARTHEMELGLVWKGIHPVVCSAVPLSVSLKV